ncbi:uncharacterized protein LOC113756214 [Coffea eugenioides]|uniref:uncharacterized protein LOC113756214 n=1 Tax=Coffea eugenioides TaxID=49369 RepID=UPI000F614165|nr:uncharacterized protein LOC113756214 [Coffea eugenioides]
MQSKEAKEKVDLAVAKWMIDASIPFNASTSAYYQTMFDAACSFGADYKAPNFYDLRGYLLTKNVKQVKNFVNSFHTTWKETGFDASDASKTAEMLYKLFREVVLFVGVKNVVHFVTDNAANYVAAGRLLEREFPTLYWSSCAAHCLNLMLHDMGKLDGHRHATSGLLDVIERYSYANPDLMSNLIGEMRLFRKAKGDFGRVSAIRDRDVMLPDEWWTCYGSTAPNLQKLAIRVLSQTCSASGCERKWNLFEHIHSKKRNRLEHQRLNDLVYVHYNLRLNQRNARGRNYDPIDFEDFSASETWILDDEPSQLTSAELESFKNEIATFAISRQSDETLNLDNLDTGDEDETNNEENVERNDLNAGCDVNELGGTEFGRSWEPWA